MAEHIVIGLDTGKNVFHVWEANRRGGARVRRSLNRRQLMRYVANHEPALIGMETCAGSNHLARVFERYGHTVGLMSAQHVRPYVKTNKSDFNDAEGCWEAVQRPTMRFVAPKSVEQQELGALHRARELVDKHRTATSNQIRGILAEFGVVLGEGVSTVRRGVPEVLEDADNELTALVREVVAELLEELRRLEERLAYYDATVRRLSRDNEHCRLLRTVPGIGEVIATAMVAKLGDGRSFTRARQVSAWLGIVPGHWGTGGKTQLGSISKRGDRYLRTKLIHGARALLRVAHRRDDALCRWALGVKARRGWNVAVVALANKLARIAWAVLTRGTPYDPKYVAA